jgi:hypothetical protein
MLDVQQQGTPGEADACTEIATAAAEAVATGEETDAGADNVGKESQLQSPLPFSSNGSLYPRAFNPGSFSCNGF